MTDIQKLAPITHTGTQTIVTSRLVLRPFQMADAGDTFVWASNLGSFVFCPIHRMPI